METLAIPSSQIKHVAALITEMRKIYIVEDTNCSLQDFGPSFLDIFVNTTVYDIALIAEPPFWVFFPPYRSKFEDTNSLGSINLHSVHKFSLAST